MLIGYARVSTVDQNLGLQLDALKKAGCEQVFQDEGVSGARASRPGLDQALEALKQGDQLIVWRLDRLGRSLRHLIEMVGIFEERGIGFTSITDGIDTTTPVGKLFFHVSGAFAEFERNLISERTKAGMAAAKARGKHIGRPKKQTAEEKNVSAAVNGFSLDVSADNFGIMPADGKKDLETVQ